MSEQKGYNGWTNYETWTVALWLDNDESSHRYRQEAAQQAWDGAQTDSILSREDRARYTLADRLKEDMSEGNPLADAPTLYADLLSAALSKVDWDEIAGHCLDELYKTSGEDGAA